MSTAWDTMSQALADARETNKAVETYAYSMGGLLVDKLRYCSPVHLAALKKELKDFNIQTGKWSKK